MQLEMLIALSWNYFFFLICLVVRTELSTRKELEITTLEDHLKKLRAAHLARLPSSSASEYYQLGTTTPQAPSIPYALMV